MCSIHRNFIENVSKYPLSLDTQDFGMTNFLATKYQIYLLVEIQLCGVYVVNFFSNVVHDLENHSFLIYLKIKTYYAIQY